MRVFLPLAGLLLLLMSAPFAAAADSLSLAEAEQLAVDRDAERLRLALEAEAQAERAVAAGSLPDPELRLGAANLPVDSFALDAEPMTQVVIGIRQMLPPGDTLDLRTRRGRLLADAIAAMSAARAADVRLAVRSAWLNAQIAAAAQATIATTRDAVAPLLDAAESRYTTGGGRQADFLAAMLRLERLHERALRADERETLARARLGRWLDNLPAELAGAELPPPPAFGEIAAALASHPLVQATEARVAANLANEEIAEESFGPQWGLDFSYGYRQGVDAFGNDRPDFASAMVTMSLPLFTGNRQERELAAARRETRAAEYAREDRLRELATRLDAAWRQHEEASRQLRLIEQTLLPAARQAREAAMSAYADNALPFTDFVDTETDLLDIELRRLELRERIQLARAELAWLAGETP